jgi:cardiolipin synthase
MTPGAPDPSDTSGFLSLLALEHAVLVAAGLLVYILVTRGTRQHRHPAAAMAWVVAIAAFPWLALPVFLLFGTRKFARPQHRPQPPGPVPPAPAGAPWVTEVLHALQAGPPGDNRSVAFQADGRAALDALLAVVAGARHRVDVCTYLLADDDVGRAVLRALEQAAARGVRVRLLVDAIGSLLEPGGRRAALRAQGLTVRLFMPLLHNPLRGRTNLRNHRKLVVADAQVVWSGGRNLACSYFLDGARPAWDDLSFTVEGPLAAAAAAQFDADWRLAGGRGDAAALPHGEELAPLHGEDAPRGGGHWIHWLASGPDKADDTLYALLLAAAHHARERLLLATPYFVPDDALLQALCMACRRGVQVRLLLPAASNHRLADLARGPALRQLVAAGAEVRLAPRMQHGKAVVVDAAVALCGSANLDGRSLFLNYEAMAVFHGDRDIAWLASWHAAACAGAQRAGGRRPPLARELLEDAVRLVGFQL